MEKLTKQDCLLVSAILQMAANKFSNHGCNDLAKETEELITDPETLCKALRNFNGDPENVWPENINQIGDDSLMGYYAERFQAIANELT